MAGADSSRPAPPREAGAMPPPPPAPPKVVFSKAAGAHAGSQPGEPAADPVRQPREFLNSVFDMVVATDKEGYFLRPVDESVAPNYYKQIKHPLCFADMRSKLEAGTYTSFKAIMADFELIVNNARSFNKEKTKCYKCAMTLSRNVVKIMSAHEIGIRKAFSVLHPHGAGNAPTAGFFSGGAGSTGNRTFTNFMDTSDITSSAQGTSSAAQGTGGYLGGQQSDLPTDPRDRPGEVSGRQPFVKSEPAAGAGSSAPLSQIRAKQPSPPAVLQPASNASLPHIRLAPLCKAYSDNEEEDERIVLQHHRQLPHGQHSAQRRKLVSLEALMADLRQAAVFQPWTDGKDLQGSSAQEHAAGQRETATEAAASPALASAGQQGPDAAIPGEQLALEQHTAEENQTRHSIEWQCRWLELRMRELQSQMTQLGATPDNTGTRQAGQQHSRGSGSGTGEGGSGSSAAVTAELEQRKKQLSAAAARHLHGGPTAPLLPPDLPQAKLHSPLILRPLASATFFAGRPAQSTATPVPVPAASMGAAAAAPMPQPSIPADGDVEMADAVESTAAGTVSTAAAPPSTQPASAVSTPQADPSTQPAAAPSTGQSSQPAAAATTVGSAEPSVAAAGDVDAVVAGGSASTATATPPATQSEPTQAPAVAFAPPSAGTASASPAPTQTQVPTVAPPAAAAPAAAAQTPDQGAGAPAMPIPPVLGSIPNAQLPAAVFASLEVLEMQLMDVKRGLQAAFALDKGRIRPGVSRTGASLQLPNAASGAVAIAAPGAASLMRRQSSARPAPPLRSASLASMAPFKSGHHDPASKRKRADGDVELPSLYSARTLDRPSAAIYIPPIRDLSQEEQEARDQAEFEWAEAYRTQGPVALDHPPPAVAAVLAACGDEGSSSEDTSDEAYAGMHEIMLEEERKRFAAVEGQRRRNKQSSKNAANASGAGGQGSAGTAAQGAPAGPSRRPSYGLKTPRAPSAKPIPLSPHTTQPTESHTHAHAARDATHHHPLPPAAARERSPPILRSTSHTPPAHLHPFASTAATANTHQPLPRVPSIATGSTLCRVPSVVLVPASTPPCVPAVATAPHPFRLQTTDSLLPGMTVVPGMASRLSPGLTSHPPLPPVPCHPPRPPSNPGAPSPRPLPPAITPPPSNITTRGSSPRLAPTSPIPASVPQPPIIAPPPPQPPPAPRPRRTPRLPPANPPARPTPSPPPTSSNDEDTWRSGRGGNRSHSVNDAEADDDGESTGSSQQDSGSESNQEGEGEEGSNSGSDRSDSESASGSSDGSGSASEEAGDGDGDDAGERSSGGGSQRKAQKRNRADRPSSQARRSSGGGSGVGAARPANGTAPKNGRRVRGSELGKVAVRMTRSQDMGKLRSSSSKDQRRSSGGGAVKPTRTPSHGGAAPVRRR